MISIRYRAAALLLVATVFVSLIPGFAIADEGMFMPDKLNQLPLKKLQQRGLKIPISDIFNPNGPSIKDAVVIVDGGTGEFLSAEGLMLTNHHVAFDALVAASDSSKDYATKGYLAHNRGEAVRQPVRVPGVEHRLVEAAPVLPEAVAGDRQRVGLERRHSLALARWIRRERVG